MGRIITITSQKGGVGKTTLAFHYALGASRLDRLFTLGVDLDGQANFSYAVTRDLEIGRRRSRSEASHLFASPPVIEPMPVPGDDHLFLLHGTAFLFEIHTKVNLLTMPQVRQALLSAEVPGHPGRKFDLVVIDTSPTVTEASTAALALADLVLLPVEPMEFSVLAVSDTLELFHDVRQRMNPDATFKFLVNRYHHDRAGHRSNLANLERIAEAATAELKSQAKEAGKPEPEPIEVAATLASLASVERAMELGIPIWDYRSAPPGTRDTWARIFSSTGV